MLTPTSETLLTSSAEASHAAVKHCTPSAQAKAAMAFLARGDDGGDDAGAVA